MSNKRTMDVPGVVLAKKRSWSSTKNESDVSDLSDSDYDDSPSDKSDSNDDDDYNDQLLQLLVYTVNTLGSLICVLLGEEPWTDLQSNNLGSDHKDILKPIRDVKSKERIDIDNSLAILSCLSEIQKNLKDPDLDETLKKLYKNEYENLKKEYESINKRRKIE